MRRGAWHQFGDRSQRLVLEQLQGGVGVGAIISARDLAMNNAADYAQQYRTLGAGVLIDHQFYVPDFSNAKLASYPTNQFRDSISGLNQVNSQQLAGLAQAIDSIHTSIPADGIIAPAAVYEAGRPDIVDLNARLFETAKAVGDARGFPTYATVVLGRSARLLRTARWPEFWAVLRHLTCMVGTSAMSFLPDGSHQLTTKCIAAAARH